MKKEIEAYLERMKGRDEERNRSPPEKNERVVVNQVQLTRYIVTTKAKNVIPNEEEMKREIKAHLEKMKG
ncbi:5683_t:CDS:2 [Dentiscutata heterogama]|uniref:5683_t:CDS:1 n=1 Tax=Dentiscutata heterogama TaxID=1316150 RepID=A0ACA9KYE7_9GLOM|nr:5683_t:CDS:2 [Dentiscutata heterogama]